MDTDRRTGEGPSSEASVMPHPNSMIDLPGCVSKGVSLSAMGASHVLRASWISWMSLVMSARLKSGCGMNCATSKHWNSETS